MGCWIVSSLSWKSRVQRWEQNDKEESNWIMKAHVSLSMAWLDELLSWYSVSIQSMNQWILIRFRGVTALFLFVVTSAPALWGLLAPVWQRHHLLRKEEDRKWGDSNRGRGSLRGDVKAVSSSRCVLSHSPWCAFVLLWINLAHACMCVCPWDNNECTVLEHSLLNTKSFLFADFCGIFPFSTLQWKNYEMN